MHTRRNFLSSSALAGAGPGLAARRDSARAGASAGITSWAQAFLKFALSHPAVTAVISATGEPNRQSDNLLGGVGPILDGQQRQSLIAALG
ncbi:MAG TPA: hypothetical protein VK325_08985 [Pseudoxanthomonas sp.]|nr:hypothetical protein [Pseudoxanthomonas sp.]